MSIVKRFGISVEEAGRKAMSDFIKREKKARREQTSAELAVVIKAMNGPELARQIYESPGLAGPDCDCERCVVLLRAAELLA